MHENAYFHKGESDIQSFRLLFSPKKVVVNGLRPSHHGRLTLALSFLAPVILHALSDSMLVFLSGLLTIRTSFHGLKLSR
jgi:hypothetical protein